MSKDDLPIRLLLPARRHLGSGGAAELPRLVSRADRRGDAEPGRVAQLGDALGSDPARWPAAALTRDLDCNDAGRGLWLRADPAQIQVEMSSARLMRCAEPELVPDDALDVLDALFRPLFGDEGMQFSAPTRERWYLQLSDDAVVPPMAPPDAALGRRMDEQLPQGRDGGRWRRLMNEAQMLLHAQRGRIGEHVAVNSLWFWGAGRLPWARLPVCGPVLSNDSLLCALAKANQRPAMGLDEMSEFAALGLPPGSLLDLSEPASVQNSSSTLAALASAEVDVFLRSGERYAWRPGQRWRIWRKSFSST